MSSATANHQNNDDHRHHLRLDALPLVDLRLLSQSELLSLSHCSSSRQPLSDDDDESNLKIDPTVINESAGSRKQTFYRLRLAPPRGAHNSNDHPSSSDPRVNDQQNRTSNAENSQIVTLLKSLFNIESKHDEEEVVEEAKEDNLVPVSIEYTDYFHGPSPPPLVNGDGNHNSTAGFVFGAEKKRGRPRKHENQNSSSNGNYGYYSPISVGASDVHNYGYNSHISVGVTNGSGASNGVGVEGKKKRGRQRKNETENPTNAALIEFNKEENRKELTLVNSNGVNVDLAVVGRVEDPYAEEITRRTEGFVTQEQLLGFLNGLNGDWVSARKKRMIVDASIFCNSLPMGWKLMLSIKKNAGHFWLVCCRYISPSGQQFVSWKKVATYFSSTSQLLKELQPSCDHICDSIQLPNNLDSGNAVGVLHNDKNEAKPISCSTVPITSISSGHGEQDVVSNLGTTGNIQGENILHCHKCPMTFSLPDDFLHHLLSHKKVAKKLGHNAYETVIMKDGKYECQFCQKSFQEKQRYDGHLGNHIKMYVKRFQDTQTNRPPPDTVLTEVSKMQEIRNEQDSIGNVELVSSVTDNTASSDKVCFGAGTTILSFENTSHYQPAGVDVRKHATVGVNNFVAKEGAWDCLMEQPKQQEGSTFCFTASNDKLNIFRDKNHPVSGSMTNIDQEQYSKDSFLIPSSGNISYSSKNGTSITTPKHLEPRNEQSSDAENNENKVPSQQLQSSNCFPTFDIVMDKGDPELFRMVENDAPNFGAALTSDNTEQMEYDFLRAPTNSYSEDPKDFSFDAEMDQGFDSSAWFEKETLPSGSHQVLTMCVWCGNEIHQEASEVGPQTGSIGFMCTPCKTKYSN